METYIKSEQTESFPQGGEIQTGDTGHHQDIPPTRGVGHLNRFQGCLLPYSDTGTVQEISDISCPGSDIPIQSTTFRSVYSTLGVYCNSKGSETDGHTQGYKDPPVPRRLVGESQIPPGLSPTYSRSSENMPRTRLAGEFGKIGTGAQADLRFCRLPVRSQGLSGPTDTRPVAEPSGQDSRNTVTTDLSGPAVHVLNRFPNSYRKASSPRPAAYETHTVASQKQLEGARITRKSDSNSQVPAPSQWWLSEGNVLTGQPLHSIKHALQIFTDASKEGSICHEVQQQVTSFCDSATGSSGHSSGCTQSAMGGSGCICLPTSSHLGQSGGKAPGLPMQENHSDCSRVAQHTLVLGPSGHVQPNSSEPAKSAKSADITFQSDPSQKSDNPKSPCMAPRASAIKEQGFSEAVAARIEAPQRESTRSVYEAKWTIFTKWCLNNKVDFRTPPCKVNSGLPYVPVSGQEVTTQHH